jgi:ferric-dicitrate binding protein FerR (iron transport regulator)
MTKDQFIKYLQGNCTEKEFEQILAWIRDGATTLSGTKMVEELWNEFEPEAGPGELIKYNRILDKIHHQININKRAQPLIIEKSLPLKRMMTILTRAAAILLLPVLSLLLVTTFSDKGHFAKNSNDLEMEAPAGSRMNFVLGDGTKVWLNHGGKLRYPYRFEGKNRKVFLTGEAYFEVAINKEIPFIVETNHLEVRATGTEFNVSAYPEDGMVETTLVEGKVILYEKTSNKPIKELFPDQCLKFNLEEKAYSLESGNTEKYVAWKNGLLVFKNDPIAEIAKKLAKWYNVDVEISNEKAKGYTCTATFTDETLAQVLELMTLPTPVHFKLTPREKAADGSFAKQKVLIGLKANHR